MAQAKKTTKKASPNKQAEVKEEKAIDYSQYDFRLTDYMEVKAEDIVKIQQALNFAIQQGTNQVFPAKDKYVATASGVEVEKPTPEAIKNGTVRPLMDIQATFAQDNIQVTFADWVPKLVDVLNIFNNIHIENVDKGRATLRSVIEQEAKEAREKAEAAAEDAPADPDA